MSGFRNIPGTWEAPDFETQHLNKYRFLPCKDTMRFWLIDFERTAAAYGVPLKVAAQSIYQYLPADISGWLHSKSSSSRITWQQSKIHRY
jgi:hypothetical protein